LVSGFVWLCLLRNEEHSLGLQGEVGALEENWYTERGSQDNQNRWEKEMGAGVFPESESNS
jgi:hypothetical protein